MKQGETFRTKLSNLKNPNVKLVRGMGLLNAVVINEESSGSKAWDICIKMADRGLLAKPTHGNIIRFAPPLVINDTQMDEAVSIIDESLRDA